MPEFLSPAWIEELDAVGVTIDPGITFELEQVVTATPHGDVRYRFTLAHGRLRVRMADSGAEAGAAASAEAGAEDATLTVSYDTAVDLATGRRDGSDVFDAGLVRFEGDLANLQAATATLKAVAETLASVRNGTTFPPVRAGTAC
ncbi:MAG TPA: SCP2 sterol-binding domain-containing protein [Acidimicrobiia bacterium]|nr:SCP2 sterol-binding domain-containing protein [Acidimicrobiia bacterium]